jgi:hypothetical protein
MRDLLEYDYDKFWSFLSNKFVRLFLGLVSILYFPIIYKNIFCRPEFFINKLFWCYHSPLSGLSVYLLIYSLNIYRLKDWSFCISFGLIAPLSTIRSLIYFFSMGPGGEYGSTFNLMLEIFLYGKILFLIFIIQILVYLFPNNRFILLKIRHFILPMCILNPLLYFYCIVILMILHL